MILGHLDLLGSLLELENLEEMKMSLKNKLRAFSCFFSLWFGRVMKKRERELECCLYVDVRRYDDQKSTQVKSPRYGESRSCWKQKSRRGEGGWGEPTVWEGGERVMEC